MKMRTSLNDAIAEALECKWGFHYRQFIPRDIIAMYRKEALSRYPQLLKVHEFHMETIEKVIANANLDTNLFPMIAQLYSGRLDEKGRLHIFKNKTVKERAGDIQISPEHVEHFMRTVMHDDWRQEMSTDEFTFERADLTSLSSDMPYTAYGD